MSRQTAMFRKLEHAIGRRAALQELKWFASANRSPRSSRLPPLPSVSEMIERRAAGEPLQYILGTQPFGPLELLVRPPTLIPRPETEEWTLRVAEKLRPESAHRMRVLDICTGSGCIPLLLCHLWPRGSTHALAVDISDSALKLAADNVLECGISTSMASDRSQNSIQLKKADMLLPSFAEIISQYGPFDLITSNPPYIPISEYQKLSPSVAQWEDPHALIGDPQDLLLETPSLAKPSGNNSPQSDGKGLTFYRALSRLIATSHMLFPGAPLISEVGAGQAQAVKAILVSQQDAKGRFVFSKTDIWTDVFGIERVVLGWRSS